MKQENYEEFNSIMTGTGTVFEKQISQELLDIYWRIFADLSIDKFRMGVEAHMIDQKVGMFFPSPANILAKIQPEMSDSDRRAEAAMIWQDVLKAASGGNYKTDNQAALMAVQSCGGIKKLGYTNYDELVFVEKSFIANYIAFAKRPDDILKKSLEDNKTGFKLLGM